MRNSLLTADCFRSKIPASSRNRVRSKRSHHNFLVRGLMERPTHGNLIAGEALQERK
ncbi:hypothetical protein QUB70_25565 [Microcoleus sp. A003_D6]|uniref:hypothetical protein n=1 Tax=Microcoleus sp. A003_D6 TaxID=3055266 RepID=UPI002FD1FDA5